MSEQVDATQESKQSRQWESLRWCRELQAEAMQTGRRDEFVTLLEHERELLRLLIDKGFPEAPPPTVITSGEIKIKINVNATGTGVPGAQLEVPPSGGY